MTPSLAALALALLVHRQQHRDLVAKWVRFARRLFLEVDLYWEHLPRLRVAVRRAALGI